MKKTPLFTGGPTDESFYTSGYADEPTKLFLSWLSFNHVQLLSFGSADEPTKLFFMAEL